MILIMEFSDMHYFIFVLITSLPELLFLTSFSLFIYFLGKIVTEEESDSSNLLKPFFIFLNVFTYLSLISISLFCKIVMVKE